MRLLLVLLLLPALAVAQDAPITEACSDDSEIGFWYGELIIESPEKIADSYVTGAMSNGGDEPWPDTTGLLLPGTTGEVVIARDPGDGDDPDEGCTTFTNADEVAGKIALIRRGACSFNTKALNAQAAGSVGWIVYMDERTEDGQGNEVTDHSLINMAYAGPDLFVEIPGLFVSRWLGNEIVSQIEDFKNTVVATMVYQPCYYAGDLAGEGAGSPVPHALAPSYPNPFTNWTRLALTLDRAQHVAATVYDMLGREVAVLHDGPLAASTEHALTFEARSLPAGVYLVRVTGETFAETRRVTLTR